MALLHMPKTTWTSTLVTWLIREWVMSHVWMSHVTCEWVMSHVNESRHMWMSHVISEWVPKSPTIVTWLIRECVKLRMWIESCHTHEWVTGLLTHVICQWVPHTPIHWHDSFMSEGKSHVNEWECWAWMSNVNDSRHVTHVICQWVPHFRIHWHDSFMSEARLMCEWVMSHIRMMHVASVDESRNMWTSHVICEWKPKTPTIVTWLIYPPVGSFAKEPTSYIKLPCLPQQRNGKWKKYYYLGLMIFQDSWLFSKSRFSRGDMSVVSEHNVCIVPFWLQKTYFSPD